jgi:hypothetical protein
MTHRQYLALSLVFGTFLVTPFACAPQVIDAVDPAAETGGSEATGGEGGAGEGNTGGSATTGGNGGTTGNGGSGTGTGGTMTCPDGGSDGDRDGDSTIDCRDECPDDPDKSGRGLCGCGLPDIVEDGPTCADLVALLSHRYAFKGSGVQLFDTASGGNADGEVVNAELSGSGSLVLAGAQSDQYAGLPNYLLSTTETGSVTLEAWVLWTPGPAWQRIFDFGDNDNPREGEQGNGGISYLFLTPRTPNDPNAELVPFTAKMRAAYRRPGNDEWEIIVDAERAMPSGVDTHVAVVIDAAAKTMSLFIDGKLQNGSAYFRNPGDSAFTSMQGPYNWSAPVTGDAGTVVPPSVDLTRINDINNWLGRSQFSADAELQATFYEFRIYGAALSPELVEISYKGGPDAVFLQ